MQTEQASIVDEPSSSVAYVSMPRGEIIKVVLLGLLAGLVVPLATFLITHYFIQPVFCQAGNDGQLICASGAVIANHIAAVIVAVVAFVVMTRWGIYRALLLAAATTLVMWGLQKYAAPLTTGYWLEYYLFSALLYGLAYLTFYWLLRLTHFFASLLLTTLLVIGGCMVMVMNI